MRGVSGCIRTRRDGGLEEESAERCCGAMAPRRRVGRHCGRCTLGAHAASGRRCAQGLLEVSTASLVMPAFSTKAITLATVP